MSNPIPRSVVSVIALFPIVVAVIFVPLLTHTFIAHSRSLIKLNLQEKREKPPKPNPAA